MLLCSASACSGLPAPLRQAWFMSGQAGAIAYVIYELFGTNPFDEWANDDRVKYVKTNLLGTPKPRKVRVMLWLVDAFAQIKYLLNLFSSQEKSGSGATTAARNAAGSVAGSITNFLSDASGRGRELLGKFTYLMYYYLAMLVV